MQYFTNKNVIQLGIRVTFKWKKNENKNSSSTKIRHIIYKKKKKESGRLFFSQEE